MTALTVTDRQEDASPRPVPWRRMIWVIWRQHRAALAGVAALLGVLAVYLWFTGLQLHHAYTAAIACHPASSIDCGQMISNFNNTGSRAAQATVIPFDSAVSGTTDQHRVISMIDPLTGRQR